MIICCCGDVMTGRGVDQILSHPGHPRLWEEYVTDARTYVQLAEAVAGPVPRPVPPAWPWGDALDVLARLRPDVRLINLETSITGRGAVAAGKGVHYRMHPDNIDCLAVVRPDACVLANNHVLDFGYDGLADTLGTLTAAGISAVGAGADAGEARRPVIYSPPGGGRAVVFAAATASSGVPPAWAAAPHRPGINLLPDLSRDTADDAGDAVRRVKREGDVVVFSIHWGSNWGYDVPRAHVEFAHRLIEHGVDVVFGHSSHHPRPIEVYRGKLILYGAGDFIDDYEGIGGHEQYRPDLRLMYFPTVAAGTGQLRRLHMVPLRARQMRLCRPPAQDVTHLGGLLDRICRPFGSRIRLAGGDTLELA